jgi:hypothetical protein
MGIGLLQYLRKHITCSIMYNNKNNNFVSWNVWTHLYMLMCWPPALTNLFQHHHKTNPFPNNGQEFPADEFLSSVSEYFLIFNFQLDTFIFMPTINIPVTCYIN